MKIGGLVACAPLLLLGACATNGLSHKAYPITYNSYPMGAQLVIDGKVFCTTPCSAHYDFARMPTTADPLISGELTFKWESGATLRETVRMTKADARRLPDGAMYTGRRPADAPNIDVDMAVHNRILQAREQQAEAQRQQQRLAEAQAQRQMSEDAAVIGNMIGAFNAGYNQSRLQTTTCYGDTIGGTAMVRCF